MCPPNMTRRLAVRSKSVSFATNELIELFDSSDSDSHGQDVPPDEGDQAFVPVPNKSRLLRRNLSVQPLFEENEAGFELGGAKWSKGRQSGESKSRMLLERRRFMAEIRQKIAEEKKRIQEEQMAEERKGSSTSVFSTLTESSNMAAICSTIAILYVLTPTTDVSQITHFESLHGFCYLLAFTIEFGSQIWMTFVSGIALFFRVPRHIFGKVQMVLFPLYFLLNSIWAFVILATYKTLLGKKAVQKQVNQLSYYDNFLEQINIQVLILTLVFILQAYVRLFLSPSLVKLIDSKAAVESAAGVGKEVGTYELGELRKCPHFMRMHKGFRKMHTAIAACNLLAMCLNGIHLHHIAGIVISNFK